jgi:hypothetical protein
MGIMVQNNEKRSELSDRITADLREKGRRNSLTTEDNVDFDIDDSEYKSIDTHKTGRFAWAWILLIFLAVASIVMIFMP